jgi:hypothetical protein
VDVAEEIERRVREAVGLTSFTDEDPVADQAIEIPEAEEAVLAGSSRSATTPAGAPAS